jgi:hypothetical protein
MDGPSQLLIVFCCVRVGCWCLQNVTILHSFLQLTEAVVAELEQMAFFLCRLLRQESVLLQMDGLPALLSATEPNPLIALWAHSSSDADKPTQ